MQILYCIVKESLKSCFFKMKPASFNGSVVSQFLAPGSRYISIFCLSLPVKSSQSRRDSSCFFFFASLSFAMEFPISFISFCST